MFAPGVRVVRGPDWNWENQDGGEGHVGTVCQIGRSGSLHSPEKTVVVRWDSGHRIRCSVGHQDQYDLTLIDNAQIGVKYPNLICDGCSEDSIDGIRFHCAQCSNYDLCATCYGSDIHDLEHPFIRYQTTNSVGVSVPARQNSVKVQLKGIFVGAKVVRGPDWKCGEQDGGEGKTGRVIEISGWNNESFRSVAIVQWESKCRFLSMLSRSLCRLGHNGFVDLKYIEPAAGGHYYRDHMPVLGQPEEAARPSYSIGDRVKVCLNEEALMKLQQGHGRWNPRVTEYLTKVGTVLRITYKGDIQVQYEGCASRWIFHPAALIKVFHVGDIVTIINDAAKLEQLQRGHGEWIGPKQCFMNKSAKVIQVLNNGDLYVKQIEYGSALTMNPKCVRLERLPLATETERSNSMKYLSNQRADHEIRALSGLYDGSSSVEMLVREAVNGKLGYVQHYLEQYPEQVDGISAGKTCLLVSADQGDMKLVKYLLSLGANVNFVDKEGDSSLHYAANADQPSIIRVLLIHGAEINVLNSSHCSALHISARRMRTECVRILLEYGADVNIQDSYGYTALHDAIGKKNVAVVDLLCSAPNLDLTVGNNRGFNALHYSSLKGNSNAVRRILQLAQQLVDVKKDDGFAALHLAALNGHANVVEALVKDGQADINIRNNRRQTPFLLAVSQGHAAAIEKLVDLGCDILAKDEDGDNALHLCVIKKSNLIQEVPQEDAPQIWAIYQSLQHIVENRLMCAILCYLAKNGCNVVDANKKGERILDWVCDKTAQDLILSYANRSGAATVRVYHDGDLLVKRIEDGCAWILNPPRVKLKRLPLATATATGRSCNMMLLSHLRAEDIMMPWRSVLPESSSGKLVREATHGKLDYVQHYLEQYPEQVDVMGAGKTCLQVSAYQGHWQLVVHLLSLGANVNVVDKEGDSTLHYAAFGNQPEIMRLLLMRGAEINVLNWSHYSALHISTHSMHTACVRILLEYGADVNIQDSYGYTALHDAIEKENVEVVDLLCSVPNLDLTVRDNRGFNALHYSSLKGNSNAVRRILQLAQQLVDVKKDDGFAALHLAALKGHANVVEALVEDGQADINIRNNRRQTPFLLAVSQGHAAAIEKLVDLGCDILAKDEDGDNAMHLCVIKKPYLIQEAPQEDAAPQIWAIYQSLQHIVENRLMCAILCYLVNIGCNIDDANNKGKRILDSVCHKIAATVPGEPSSSTGDGTEDINVQLIDLSVIDNGSNDSSTNTGMVDPVQQSSSSNPPSPLRRRHQADNRDTPSPSNPLIPSVVDDEATIPKKSKIDHDHNQSPPLPTEAPTTSNQANDMNFTENESMLWEY